MFFSTLLLSLFAAHVRPDNEVERVLHMTTDVTSFELIKTIGIEYSLPHSEGRFKLSNSKAKQYFEGNNQVYELCISQRNGNNGDDDQFEWSNTLCPMINDFEIKSDPKQNVETKKNMMRIALTQLVRLVRFRIQSQNEANFQTPLNYIQSSIQHFSAPPDLFHPFEIEISMRPNNKMTIVFVTFLQLNTFSLRFHFDR